jgi:hypothetical protein
MKTLTALLVTGTLSAGLVLAQTPSASLGGTISDSSGAVIPNAAVTATGIETGVATKTTSNATGSYTFPSLQPGNYRVEALAGGFEKVVYPQVVLEVSAQVRLNFTMPVATSSTTLEVTAAGESPLLMSGAAVGGTIQGQQIMDLPLVDQNAVNLAITQAGFAGGVGTGVNVAGGETQFLATTVNGISVSNNRLTRAGGLNSMELTQTVDMVEEVKVVSSPADVEYGHAVGQVQMIIRSGTNQLHGSAVDGLRNTDLNANTFFNNYTNLPRQVLKRNQFAARIGGPIRRNKSFFFFVYDGNRQRTSASSNQTVLTAPARLGQFRFFPGVLNGNAIASVPTVTISGAPLQPAGAGALQTVNLFGLDPNRPSPDASGLVSKYLGQTPLPNNYLVGDGLNTAGFLWQVPSFSDRDEYTLKIDHYFNPSNHINGVITYEHDYYTSTTPIYPTQPVAGISNVTSWFASLGLTSVIKPTLLNEFRLGFQHPNINQVGGTRAYPQIYPSNNGVLYTPGFSTFTSPIPGNIDAGLVDPVYTIGDTMTWSHGRHSVKWGAQVDYTGSNSFNINNGVVPSVTFGAGSVAVTGVSSIAGIAGNQSLAQNLLTDLSGSVASVSEGFGVANGKSPQWIVYPGRRAWHQRDVNGFIKDDFKVTSNLTLNLGIRWDWTGVPWDSWGRTPAPAGGFGGMFGISGTNFNAMWSPGASGGSLMQIQTVGPNSANPNVQLYRDYFKGFAPGVGLSWSIPYFGKDKTVLRAGYSWTRPMAQSFLGIDGSVSTFGTTASFIPTTACFLNCVNLPLSPANSNPLAIVPLTDRTQTFSTYDPNFTPPLVQNWNVSLERQLTSTMTIAARFVGNATSHLVSGASLNTSNIFENGILAAFNTTIAGGNAPLFDQIFNGYNLGLGAVNGTTVTGSASVRQYSNTKTFFANDSPGAFASFLNTTNAFTGVNGGLLSHAGLPQNFVVVNPQYASASAVCSCRNSWYDSAILEFQKRFKSGWTFQTNVTWAKTLLEGGGGDGSFSFRNPRNANLDKSLATYNSEFAWKASGSYQLPFGKGKAYLNNATGASAVLGKIAEGWQVSGILTAYSGNPLAITAGGTSPFTSTGTNTAMQAGPLSSSLGKVTTASNGVGVVYFAGLKQITDPSCANLTTQQGLNAACTMKALTNNGSVVLENSTPGVLGSLAPYSNLTGPGLFDLDVNIGRRFTVKEHYTLEFRVDAIGVTNTPHFTNPTTNINSTSFGVIAAPSTNGANAFTTPPPYVGNRVLVVNLRFTF